MNQLIVSQDHCIGNTSISNVFIDMFMKDANDAQLKIYLYLIRVMNANMPVSISDMADKFNHTEKDVIRSLQYWERNHLLSLEYDADQNIIGIHLNLCIPQQNNERVMAPIVPLKTVKVPDKQPLPEMHYDCASEPLAPERKIPDKPNYSAHDINSYSCNNDFLMLTKIAEQYLGRILGPDDISSLLYIYKELEFSVDLADTLIQYCVENKKKTFAKIEKVAQNWYLQNITTSKEALTIARSSDKTAVSVMKALGKTGAIVPREIEYINTWTITFGFSLEIILEACNRTVMATDTHRFEYANGILSNWRKQKVSSIEDIEALEVSFKQAQTKRPELRQDTKQPVGRQKNQNKFNQYTQNDYDYAALEREILSN